MQAGSTGAVSWPARRRRSRATTSPVRQRTATLVLDGFCREVARGVANLVLVLDLERIVLGGGLADIGEPLRSGVGTWLGELLVGADHRPTVEVVLAELGPDASALGAGLMAADLL